jgi:hypothetical protein
LEEKIRTLTLQLQKAADPGQARGFGALSSVVIDREVGNWKRFGERLLAEEHLLLERRARKPS